MGGVSNVARGGRGDGIKSGGGGPGSPSHCYLATLCSSSSVRPHSVSSNFFEVLGSLLAPTELWYRSRFWQPCSSGAHASCIACQRSSIQIGRASCRERGEIAELYRQ